MSGRQLVGTGDARIDAPEGHAVVQAPPRKLDLCRQGNRYPLRAKSQLPALRRVGRLVLGYVLDLDAARLEDLSEWTGCQDVANPVAQRLHVEAVDVEVHVLRVANAAKEETEVAAALDDDQAFVHTTGELDEKVQMKLLDRWWRTNAGSRRPSCGRRCSPCLARPPRAAGSDRTQDGQSEVPGGNFLYRDAS